MATPSNSTSLYSKQANLSSPCIDIVNKTICPNRNYPSCIKRCVALSLFRDEMLDVTEEYLKAVDTDLTYSINLYYDGVNE
jgi:hypothetical protein